MVRSSVLSSPELNDFPRAAQDQNLDRRVATHARHDIDHLVADLRVDRVVPFRPIDREPA